MARRGVGGVIPALLRWGAMGALLWALAAVAVALVGSRERVGPAAVLVVLGNRVYPDGRCSPRLAARLDRAVAAWHAGVAPMVIVSGGVSRDGVDEASGMRGYLLRAGLPDSAIVRDSLGINSWETARFTAAWLRAHHRGSVVAVSQYFHLPRCGLALRRHGVDTVYVAKARFWEWRDLYSAPREVVGLLRYATRPAPPAPRSKEMP